MKLDKVSEKCGDTIRRVPSSPRCSNPLFGPFIDETLTMLLDRMLYYMGLGDNIKCDKDNSTLTICESKCESICSTSCSSHALNSEECKPIISTCNALKQISKCSKCKPVICTKCKVKTSCIENRPAIRPISNRSAKPIKTVNLLKRSFSLCSLACRQFRNKICGAPKYCTPRWLWTKEQSYINGCQIYEVFKNSCIKSHPNQFDHDAAARIILVILPSGIIMPFETVSCH